MIPWALILAFSLGGVAVLQGGLNRTIASSWGLAPAVVLNTLVLLLVALLYLWEARGSGTASLGTFRWWFLLPGIFGFSLVAGIPWAIARVGALKVFVAIVAGQMLVSLLWDLLREGIGLTLPRVLGALCCLAGVVLMAWRPE